MGHPVLQDGDSNGRLILDCFRETLTPAQHKELEEKLNVQKYDGGDWRHCRHAGDCDVSASVRAG